VPGFDGTGPNGSGPFTGRGMGYCIDRPRNFQALFPGRGLRRYPYVVPAVSLLYRLGRRHILPFIGAGYGRRIGRGR